MMNSLKTKKRSELAMGLALAVGMGLSQQARAQAPMGCELRLTGWEIFPGNQQKNALYRVKINLQSSRLGIYPTREIKGMVLSQFPRVT